MKEEIRKIMQSVFGCEIPEQGSQNTIEKWDSLNHLKLIIELELAFDVEFEPEEIAEMKDVSSIERMLVKKK